MNLNRTASILLAILFAAGSLMANDEKDSTNDILTERTSPEPSATPAEGCAIELTAPGQERLTFHIFSITGQLVHTVTLSGESVRVDLPRGCYIVKCGRWSKKVLVH